MKRIILAITIFFFGVSFAEAQGPVKLCYSTSSSVNNCIPVSLTTPLPVVGSISITFPTIGAAVPATGIYNGINVSGTLRGLSGLSVGSIFPATVAIVDDSGNQITSFGSTTNLAPITPAAATATQSSVLGGQYNSTQATFTNGQQGSLQISSRGELKIVNFDAAGNARGANVNASNQLSVSVDGGTVGGYDFQFANALTVQNAAYSAGNSLGGLVTVTAARTSGGSGVLNGIRIKSNGGSTNTIWVYAWSKTPAATCTDKSAYVASTSDQPYAIPGFPTSVVLGGAPGAWDTSTYSQLTGLFSNFKNQDTSPGTAIYYCLVTAGAVTPATTTDLTLVSNGMQD